MAASSTDSLLLGQPWHHSAHRVAKAPGPLRPAGLALTPSAPLSSLTPSAPLSSLSPNPQPEIFALPLALWIPECCGLFEVPLS